MKTKIIDTFLISLLTISAATTASLLAPQAKIPAAFCGGTTGLSTGLSIFRVKNLLTNKIDKLIYISNHIDSEINLNNNSDKVKKKYDREKKTALNKIKTEETITWLEQQNIEVKNYYKEEEGDGIFNEIALFLGYKYNLLQPIYEQIKRNIPKGTSFQINLASKTELEISTATQFCNKLSNYAFLNTYNYNNATKTIYASPPQQGRIINFLNGGWFERFVFHEIINLLKKNNFDFSCLLNPQINISNGNNFELDLLFLIDKVPLWLECKTGDYQAYILKYSEFRKVLSISKARACLIILGISNELTNKLNQLYEITVLNENNFLEYIELLIKNNDNNQDANNIIKNKSELHTVFKKAGIRPLPEIREEIITEILKAKLPQPLLNIKKEISQKKEHISNNKIQDIFNVLLQSRCFLNENKKPITSFKETVYSLVSNDYKTIENLCLETYKNIILSIDLNYFNCRENINNFEDVVGGIYSLNNG